MSATDPTPAPASEERTAGAMPESDALEITARFARSAAADAPRGVLVLEGRDEPIPFAGWLDLMAIVEALLQDARADEA